MEMASDASGRRVKGRGGRELDAKDAEVESRYKGKGGIFERLDDGEEGPIRCSFLSSSPSRSSPSLYFILCFILRVSLITFTIR